MNNLKVYQGQLFNQAGQVIQPNSKGIVEIEVLGEKKRFVFEKLVDYLERNGYIYQKPVLKAKKTRPNKGIGKGVVRRKKVIVTGPDGKEQTFESSAAAAKKLNICRTNIPHVLSGKYKTAKGYKIRYA